jgi:DNA repair ATPase RecN
MKKGFYQELMAERAALANTRDVSELFHSINAQLIAQTGVELTLARVNRLLDTQKDPALGVMKECLKTALDKTRDAIEQMRELGPTYLDVDTSGIVAVEKNIEEIKTLAAERKVTPEEFSDSDYDIMIARLTRIREAPGKIKEFDVKLIKANEVYRQAATILSEERRKAAKCHHLKCPMRRCRSMYPKTRITVRRVALIL